MASTFKFILAALLAITAVSVITMETEGSHRTPSIIGWIWSGTTDDDLSPTPGVANVSGFGWISMISHNPSTGCVVPPAGSASSPDCYGVDFPLAPPGNGAVADYAWSPNVGWIDFQPGADPAAYPGCGYPTPPCSGVTRTGNQLQGWARVVSIAQAIANGGNNGGFEGWIKTRGTISPPNGGVYGVSVASGGNSTCDGAQCDSHLEGFAWSDEFGWIGFGTTFPGDYPPFPEINFGAGGPPPGPPDVTVSAPLPNASESGPTSGQFAISCSGNFTNPFQVTYAIGGSATNGGPNSDLSPPIQSTNHTFNSCPSSFTIDVNPVNDGLVEGTENVVLTANPNPSYNLVNTTAIVNIADNNGSLPPTVSCTGSPSSGWKINWSADAIGGTPPYTFTWFDLGGASSPVVPPSYVGNSVTATYPGNNTYTARVRVTDVSGASDDGSCQATAVQFKRIEIPPFFF